CLVNRGLGVQVPSSAPSSKPPSDHGRGPFANGFANSGVYAAPFIRSAKMVAASASKPLVEVFGDGDGVAVDVLAAPSLDPSFVAGLLDGLLGGEAADPLGL
ncbi:MAG TPA: hypothetical protein VIL71_23085, partial [Spirillospora sp.]